MYFSWPSLLVLFLLRAAELGSLFFFMSPVAQRRKKWWGIPLTILVTALLLVFLHEMINRGKWMGEFVFTSFVYYPVIFASLFFTFDISLKKGLYYLLLFFLSIHALRFLGLWTSSTVFDVTYLANESLFANNLLIAVLVILVLNVEFWLLKPFVFRYPNRELTYPQLLLVTIATIPVIYMTNLFLVLGLEIFDIPLTAMLISLISSICGVVIVIGYTNTVALAKNKQELAVLETLLATQQKQYQLKKETIELINSKYHDLKKHLHYLEALNSDEEREKYIDTMRTQVSVMDAFHDTGNETLDIVLSDKDMECRKNGIALLVFIDGKELDFLQPLEIVTIFSNALDNSIEAVLRLPEHKRSITIRMREYDTWLVVNIENSFEGSLKWQGGRLLTTKSNNENHGYGLCNLTSVVEKYGGNVTTEVKDGIFTLTLLFPKNQ